MLIWLTLLDVQFSRDFLYNYLPVNFQGGKDNVGIRAPYLRVIGIDVESSGPGRSSGKFTVVLYALSIVMQVYYLLFVGFDVSVLNNQYNLF